MGRQILSAAIRSRAPPATRLTEASNLRLLAQCDLAGRGNGGEGMGIHAAKGRRTLFIAHESAPRNFTAVDVTDPRRPEVVCAVDLPHADVRSNSLAVCGDLMAVAYQSARTGGSPAGLEIFDLSEPSRPRMTFRGRKFSRCWRRIQRRRSMSAS